MWSKTLESTWHLSWSWSAGDIKLFVWLVTTGSLKNTPQTFVYNIPADVFLFSNLHQCLRYILNILPVPSVPAIAKPNITVIELHNKIYLFSSSGPSYRLSLKCFWPRLKWSNPHWWYSPIFVGIKSCILTDKVSIYSPWCNLLSNFHTVLDQKFHSGMPPLIPLWTSFPPMQCSHLMFTIHLISCDCFDWGVWM